MVQPICRICPICCRLILIFLFFSPGYPLMSQPREETENGNTGLASKEEYPETQYEKHRRIFLAETEKQAVIRYRYARELLEEGRLNRAHELFREIMDLYPDFKDLSLVHFDLARSLDMMGQKLEAAKFYILANEPSGENLKLQRGVLRAARLYRELGEEDQSRKILEELLKRSESKEIQQEAKIELKSLEKRNLSSSYMMKGPSVSDNDKQSPEKEFSSSPLERTENSEPGANKLDAGSFSKNTE